MPTSIVCTIGPASSSISQLKKLIRTGMSIARLNFSHGSYENHAELIKNIRTAAKEIGKKVEIMQDLQGPKIRTGILQDNITIKKGETIQIHSKKTTEANAISIDYPKLTQEIQVGERILIDDGAIELKVVNNNDKFLIAKAKTNGTIKSKRGVNFPDSNISISPITTKDRQDLAFGLSQKVDIIAMSFVKTAQDIKKLRKLIGTSKIKICAKIERKSALDNLTTITEESDLIMVARGDLGTDLPISEVPFAQKMIIKTANKNQKPVILATQILQSMIENPFPTRAEVSDATNGILDGANYLMLSNESALGKYSIQAAKVLKEVIKTTEKHLLKK